jgi:hypothetical protein
MNNENGTNAFSARLGVEENSGLQLSSVPKAAMQATQLRHQALRFNVLVPGCSAAVLITPT